MTHRCDYRIAEWIYRQHGHAALRAWHSLPFVELSHDGPGGLFAAYCSDGGEADLLSVERLPWPDAVYAAALGGVCVAWRISEGSSIHDPQAQACAAMEYGCIICTATAVGPEGPVGYAHYHEKRDGDGGHWACCTGNCGVDAAELNKTVMTILGFVSQPSVHPVSVTPVTNGGKPHEKKPWVRSDLGRIVMLDFAQAKRYGHQGGTHASPKPHQRRGHWRTYLNEKWGNLVGKQKWVRPTWVGDREWVFNGQHYRVVGTAGTAMP